MNTYNAKDIQILEGLEAVKKRPSMYIGSTDIRGLHHLIYEIIDNSIDEAISGFCDTIDVIINENSSVSIIDNGRGIPIDKHEIYNKSALEIVLTKLHAGGKFDNKTYKISGGLHGVGISVVNALSSWLIATVYRNGNIYQQKYENGIPITNIRKIGVSNHTGTKIEFLPNKSIFETINYNSDEIIHRLRELAFLNKGIKISFLDKRKKINEKFHYDGGILEYISYLNSKKNTIHKPIYFISRKNEIELEISFQYTTDSESNMLSFANNIYTSEGGTHLIGFKTALTRVINDYIKKHNINKDKKNDFSVNGEDTREGLTAIVNLKLKNPQFEGQTKTKLGNSNLKGLIDSMIYEKLNIIFEENPKVSVIISEKSILSKKAREAAKRVRELTKRKNLLEISTLPGKLSDCSEKDPKKCELFLVEGDSAGGSAKQGRNRIFQAILPFRGKILNVEKTTIEKSLKNKEITSLIKAIGIGFNKNIYIENLRYDKIIIMTDADIDGAHIRSLILTFFYRYMPILIELGHIYIAQPPLYKLKKAKNEYYLYNEEDLKNKIKEIGSSGTIIQRYKGLGEMNPEQLWNTTMDPKTRTLIKITMEDIKESNKIFNILMGEDIISRKKFIEEHALDVEYLDI